MNRSSSRLVDRRVGCLVIADFVVSDPGVSKIWDKGREIMQWRLIRLGNGWCVNGVCCFCCKDSFFFFLNFKWGRSIHDISRTLLDLVAVSFMHDFFFFYNGGVRDCLRISSFMHDLTMGYC